MVQARVGLRIDVDTRRGLDEGVPRLLEFFRGRRLHASFFVTMGPDRSGLAIRRAWRPTFLLKMLRTRAWKLYGLRTIMSGLLLPPRPVGSGAAALLRDIAAEGHEVAPHAFDHVRWQDNVDVLPRPALHADLAAAGEAFRSIFGRAPGATAAPGWRTTDEALDVTEGFSYAYASDTRGSVPFRPRVRGRTLGTPQVPTTMPTMDELIGRARRVDAALAETIRPGLNVVTMHAEVEGGEFFPALCGFIDHVMAQGARVVRLDEVVRALDVESLPVLGIVRSHLPGRSGWVASHDPWFEGAS
jgi:peptidoglycan/xylan/chitin deacetylase (PgdA/CDA1 family)